MTIANNRTRKNFISIIFTLFLLYSSTSVYAFNFYQNNYSSGLYIGLGSSVLADDVSRINKTSKIGLNYYSIGFDFSPIISINVNHSKHEYNYAFKEIDKYTGQLTATKLNAKIYFTTLDTIVTERAKSYVTFLYGQGKMTSEIFDGEVLKRTIYGTGIGFSFPLGMKELRLNAEMLYVVDETTSTEELEKSLEKTTAFLAQKGFATTHFTSTNYSKFSDYYLRFYMDYFIYLGGKKPKAVNEYLKENQKAIYKTPRVILKSRKINK